MRKSIFASILVSIAFSSAASAAYYADYCNEDACKPFLFSNSYVPQKAVSVAQANSAQVGDTIELDRTRNGASCEYFYIIWTVASTPVLNSSNLTSNGIVYCETE